LVGRKRACAEPRWYDCGSSIALARLDDILPVLRRLRLISREIAPCGLSAPSVATPWTGVRVPASALSNRLQMSGFLLSGAFASAAGVALRPACDRLWISGGFDALLGQFGRTEREDNSSPSGVSPPLPLPRGAFTRFRNSGRERTIGHPGYRTVASAFGACAVAVSSTQEGGPPDQGPGGSPRLRAAFEQKTLPAGIVAKSCLPS
jgi:hypothetical protein